MTWLYDIDGMAVAFGVDGLGQVATRFFDGPPDRIGETTWSAPVALSPPGLGSPSWELGGGELDTLYAPEQAGSHRMWVFVVDDAGQVHVSSTTDPTDHDAEWTPWAAISNPGFGSSGARIEAAAFGPGCVGAVTIAENGAVNAVLRLGDRSPWRALAVAPAGTAAPWAPFALVAASPYRLQLFLSTEAGDVAHSAYDAKSDRWTTTTLLPFEQPLRPWAQLEGVGRVPSAEERLGSATPWGTTGRGMLLSLSPFGPVVYAAFHLTKAGEVSIDRWRPVAPPPPDFGLVRAYDKGLPDVWGDYRTNLSVTTDPNTGALTLYASSGSPARVLESDPTGLEKRSFWQSSPAPGSWSDWQNPPTGWGARQIGPRSFDREPSRAALPCCFRYAEAVGGVGDDVDYIRMSVAPGTPGRLEIVLSAGDAVTWRKRAVLGSDAGELDPTKLPHVGTHDADRGPLTLSLTAEEAATAGNKLFLFKDKLFRGLTLTYGGWDVRPWVGKRIHIDWLLDGQDDDYYRRDLLSSAFFLPDPFPRQDRLRYPTAWEAFEAGFPQLLRVGDLIELTWETGDPGMVEVSLEATSHTTFDKQIAILDKDLVSLGVAHTHGGDLGPKSLAVPAAKLNGARLRFSKGEAFDFLTDIYELTRIDWLAGRRLAFRWIRDDIASGLPPDRPTNRGGAGTIDAANICGLSTSSDAGTPALSDGDQITMSISDLPDAPSPTCVAISLTTSRSMWWKEVRLDDRAGERVGSVHTQDADVRSEVLMADVRDLAWGRFVFSKAKELGWHRERYAWRIRKHFARQMAGKHVNFTWWEDRLPRLSDAGAGDCTSVASS